MPFVRRRRFRPSPDRASGRVAVPRLSRLGARAAAGVAACLGACLVALAPLAGAAGAAGAQETVGSMAASSGTVVGTVRDPAGVAVAGAQVSLVGLIGRGSTTSDGSFRLTAPVGERRLLVRRIGFSPETLAVSVVSLAEVSVAVELRPSPQLLQPQVVEAGRARYTGRLAAFNQRRDRGFGRFFTAEDIDKRNPQHVSDLLRMVPGLRVERRGGGSTLSFRNAQCLPLVWLDGTPATAGFFDPDQIVPSSLAGIEVYSGPAQVPAELMWVNGAGRCGVIALWTRMPEPRPRGPRRQVTAQELASLVASLRLYTAEQVDVPVAADTLDPVTPLYPDSLRRAGVEGAVVVEFVVDTTGRADMETFGTVLSTHPQFTEAVRRAVASASFSPARLEERTVRQLVQLPFRFVVPARAAGGEDQ